jgi:hypothetical protein
VLVRTDEPSQKIGLTVLRGRITLTGVASKKGPISELSQAAGLMVSGSLSEATRQCGDPSCACASDPSRRHGPHLYLKFSAEGKACSVYIPTEQQEAVTSQMAAGNRQRFLKALDGRKRAAKAARAKASAKA